MAQKTLKINIFPVFSLLIREFWIKNISILLQILHTPFSDGGPFLRRNGPFFCLFQTGEPVKTNLSTSGQIRQKTM